MKKAGDATYIIFLAAIALGILCLSAAQAFELSEGDAKPGTEALSAISPDPAPLSYIQNISPTSTPQFVLLSFDGSKSVDMLNETLDFEKGLEKEGIRLRFTYFINAAYFLSSSTAYRYQPPGSPRGISNIGFSNSEKDIDARVGAFNEAVSLGNEIGSHSVGHFNGSKWNEESWKQEFSSFGDILSLVREYNAPTQIEKPLFGTTTIKGFRAPDLGANESLHKTESDFKFSYDASGVSMGSEWPKKNAQGIWQIPLGTIALGKSRTPAIAMDYSLWVYQTKGHEESMRGTLRWNQDFHEVLDAYTEYFERNYAGGRAPVVIADHFTKMNDGVYWEVMKEFAKKVCSKPDVYCGTFSELVRYLESRATLASKR